MPKKKKFIPRPHEPNRDVILKYLLERTRTVPECALITGMSFNKSIYRPQQWIRINRAFRNINQILHNPDVPYMKRGVWQ